jgi:hypothetical protein
MSDIERWSAPVVDGFLPANSVDGWAGMLLKVVELSDIIAGTEFVPTALRDKPPAVAACILAGRELGIGPMTALGHLHVIEGRPSMSAQLMRALVLRAGHELRIISSSSVECTIAGRRRESDRNLPVPSVTYTIDDARRAKLDGKPNWSRYPRAMLLARATGELCRGIFADVIGGMPYTAEEVTDMGGDGFVVEEDVAGIEPARKTIQRATRKATAAKASAAASSPPAGSSSSTPEIPPSPNHPTVDLPAMEEGPRVPTSYEPSFEPMPGEVPLPLDENGPQTSPDVPTVPDVPVPPPEPGASPDEPPSPSPNPSTGGGDGPASREQQLKVFALLGAIGVRNDRPERMRVASAIIARRIESFAQLTASEASALMDTIERCLESSDPSGYLAYHVDAGEAHLALIESGREPRDADVVDLPPWDPES